MKEGWIVMTDEERLKASKEQIYTYYGCQYPEWRIAAVKSIRKILLNLDDFYEDILPELEDENENRDLVHCQIRNGWFYEAVSQAEQAIEDLFSMMMNLGDMAYFARNVIRYSATKVKRYIWDFESDNLEYVCEQLGMPYFSLDEPWENIDVFNRYKESLLRTQNFIKNLQTFHKKYYQDYCQYKHGLSVGLAPMQNPLMKDDTERREKYMERPLDNGLLTFHQGTIEQYQKRTGELPAILLLLKPDMHSHLVELMNEENLLFSTMHTLNMDEVVMVTEEACTLLKVLWHNIIWRCEEKQTDKFHRVAFPAQNSKHIYEIGFPKE